ncbi:MAG: biotin transporter BioY [Chloroherpetonaceae bacterium]|nr:biotin transporter BioY [Chloroherpetonaceae bacterium]MDW8437007.1 biotin transporter BioY [Chloroherpetonaceae bacterium]
MQTAIPQSSSRLKSIGYSLFFAALTALGAWIEIPLYPVPVTMQTFVVLLSGALLGAQWGAASQAAYLVGGLFLPIYAGGAMGASVLFGATGGYLLSFPLGAFLSGLALRSVTIETPLYAVVARVFAASLVILLSGAVWLKIALNLSVVETVMMGFAPFILGDLVKCAMVGLAVKADRWVSTHKPNLS